MSAPLKQPDLIWFTQPNYKDTRLNIDNTEGIINYASSDAMLSEPIDRTQRSGYKIGAIVYNVLQNDNTDVPDARIKYPGQVMTSYLFNYGEMVGDITVVSGLQKPLKEVQQELVFDRIISGSGVFVNVTGFIARQPYGDGFQQFAAYFDNVN